MSAPTGQAAIAKSSIAKLWWMMFLEFFIWAAWLPLIFGYLGASGLGFSESQQTWILIAFPVAAVFAVFFGNQFADRNFAAEKFLSCSHLLSGLALIGLYFVSDFSLFALLMWLHCLLYVPTIAITSSIAFAAMVDAKKEFGMVRMGGTIGWIAASWPLFFFLSDDPMAARYTFLLAGTASLIFAGYSLLLPHTPAKKSTGQLAWVKAFGSMAAPFVVVLWGVTLLDSAIHDAYFMWTGSFLTSIGIAQKWVMPIMSIGQGAEIVTMVVLGYFLTRLGWKTTMMIGLLGQTVRFAIFAYFPYPGAAVAAIFLHGICYAFFFATTFIFVDEFLPKDVRASAQGLFNLMSLGGGPIVSRILAPRLFQRFSSTVDGQQVVDYQQLFQFPLIVSVFAVLILLVAFWPPVKAASD